MGREAYGAADLTTLADSLQNYVGYIRMGCCKMTCACHSFLRGHVCHCAEISFQLLYASAPNTLRTVPEEEHSARTHINLGTALGYFLN